MKLHEILQALSVHRATPAADCVDAVRANQVSADFPPFGKMTVREARTLYQHRRKTMLDAGIRFDGMDPLLVDLDARDADEELALAAFSGPRESYLAFLDAHGRVVGCVRIEKGVTPPP